MRSNNERAGGYTISLTIDQSSRAIAGGFRAFIGEVDEQRWDLPSMPNRPVLGIRAHMGYARRRSASQGFSSEVQITLGFSRRGYEFNLSGRMDGLVESTGALIVEEVKSMTLDGAELRQLSSASFPAAKLQLALYCYALWVQRSCAVLGRLVFCSVFDDTEHDVGLDWSVEETQEFINRRADEIIDEHEARLRWLEVREQAAPTMQFPFDQMRDVQKQMYEELTDALSSGRPMLLEAPTGSGKTAVALYAVLKWAFQTGRRVVFATAKTSGQRAALSVLKLMRARGAPISSVTMTARTKICPQPVVYCHPDYCSHAAEYQEKLRRSAVVPTLLAQGLIERAQLEDAGEDLLLCPFELSKELSWRTDVVVCDYNYVFHPIIRLKKLFDSDALHPPVVIVDEAHNLVSRARSYFSPTLSAALFQKVREHAQGRSGAFGRRLETVAVDVLMEMETWLADAGLDGLPEGRGPWEPDVDALRGWQQQIAQILVDDPLRRRWRPVPGEEDALMDAYRTLTHLIEVLDTLDSDTFVAYSQRTATDALAGVLCLDASGQLAKFMESVPGLVMMSATLSPADFYKDALGLSSKALSASFPSPFPPENRGIYIADDVTTRYKEREANIPDVARIIVDTARIAAGNYAVFLPSYSYLAQIRRHLEADGFEVLSDDRSSSDGMRRALLRSLEAPLEARGLFGGAAGRLLLAVQGGSFAEAVEWPAGILKGIFVVGPGLPAMDFEQEQLRAYYDHRFGAGFDFAYLHPGMTRVIQAAGRLVRREEDKGIIVLLDERFRWNTYAQALPRHWYERSVDELVVPDLTLAVRAFWKRHLSGGDAAS